MPEEESIDCWAFGKADLFDCGGGGMGEIVVAESFRMVGTQREEEEAVPVIDSKNTVLGKVVVLLDGRLLADKSGAG